MRPYDWQMAEDVLPEPAVEAALAHEVLILCEGQPLMAIREYRAIHLVKYGFKPGLRHVSKLILQAKEAFEW